MGIPMMYLITVLVIMNYLPGLMDPPPHYLTLAVGITQGAKSSYIFIGNILLHPQLITLSRDTSDLEKQ